MPIVFSILTELSFYIFFWHVGSVNSPGLSFFLSIYDTIFFDEIDVTLHGACGVGLVTPSKEISKLPQFGASNLCRRRLANFELDTVMQ